MAVEHISPHGWYLNMISLYEQMPTNLRSRCRWHISPELYRYLATHEHYVTVECGGSVKLLPISRPLHQSLDPSDFRSFLGLPFVLDLHVPKVELRPRPVALDPPWLHDMAQQMIPAKG